MIKETGFTERDEMLLGIGWEISRKVGWYPRQVSWPYDMKEVESASAFQLLEWYRFLPSSENALQVQMINRIIERLYREGGKDATGKN